MFLDKLKEFPRTRYLLIITIGAFILFILINQLIFAPLSKLVSTYNVLDLEFAWTTDRTAVIFSSWGIEGIEAQTLGVYWDFLYIFGYGFFISGCILLVYRKLSGKIQKIGLYITILPLVAGIFDLIENINLLIMLQNPANFSSIVPFIASITALTKFSLLILGIGFFFIGLIFLLIRTIKNRLT
ncbi:MAG: conserved membrane protein of unknown function [Promethearchaeota archaeon]|nr:MAG: conserved membrane protein of unknown function [Candidatus Lokiarchaeota archaeon]